MKAERSAWPDAEEMHDSFGHGPVAPVFDAACAAFLASAVGVGAALALAAPGAAAAPAFINGNASCVGAGSSALAPGQPGPSICPGLEPRSRSSTRRRTRSGFLRGDTQTKAHAHGTSSSASPRVRRAAAFSPRETAEPAGRPQWASRGLALRRSPPTGSASGLALHVD